MAHDDSIPGRTNGSTVSRLLRQMFDTVSAKPAPPSLIDLVDQLDGPKTDLEPDEEPPSAVRFALAAV